MSIKVSVDGLFPSVEIPDVVGTSGKERFSVVESAEVVAMSGDEMRSTEDGR